MDDKEYLEAYSKIEESVANYTSLNNTFKSDIRIIRYVLIKSSYYFNFVPLELKQNKDFIKEIASTKIRLELLNSNMRDDKEIVKLYVDYDSSISSISERLKKDIDLLNYAILKNNKNFHVISEELKNDKSYIMSLIKSGASIYDFLNKELKKDIEIIELVLEPKIINNNNLYKVACEIKQYPEHIKWKDSNFVKLLLETNDDFWKKVPPNILKIDDVVLLLKKRNKRILYHLPSNILSNIDNMNMLVENIIDGKISLKNHNKTIFNAILKNKEYSKNFKRLYGDVDVKDLNNDVILENLYNQIMQVKLLDEIEVTNKKSKKLKF